MNIRPSFSRFRRVRLGIGRSEQSRTHSSFHRTGPPRGNNKQTGGAGDGSPGHFQRRISPGSPAFGSSAKPFRSTSLSKRASYHPRRHMPRDSCLISLIGEQPSLVVRLDEPILRKTPSRVFGSRRAAILRVWLHLFSRGRRIPQIGGSSLLGTSHYS